MLTYAVSVLEKNMIVAADSNKEQYNLDIIENMYPLLALGSLATNIEHSVCQVTGFEDSLADASGSQPRS